MYHYAGGHPGYEAEPGIAQLVYYGRHLISNFGPVAAVLAVAGAGVASFIDWRRAAVLLSFPVTLMWLLASQTVHFERNVLSMHAFIAILASWGFLFMCERITRFGEGRRSISEGRRRVAMAALLVLTVPVWHAVDQLRDRTDSRTLAAAWINERVPPEWTIVVPSQLGMDVEGLVARGRAVKVVDLHQARDPETFRRIVDEVPKPAMILAPRWGEDPRFPGGELASALNETTGRLRVVEEFGINPVLVNSSQPVPSGSPAFVLAELDPH
jgi:hypothetical protein